MLITHPLVQHKLSLMRDHDTPTAEFRRLLSEISLLLAYEATRARKLREKGRCARRIACVRGRKPSRPAGGCEKLPDDNPARLLVGTRRQS
jgi:hypothetical protein